MGRFDVLQSKSQEKKSRFNNKYPNNKYPNNKYPNNKYPNNKYPNNKYPNIPKASKNSMFTVEQKYVEKSEDFPELGKTVERTNQANEKEWSGIILNKSESEPKQELPKGWIELKFGEKLNIEAISPKEDINLIEINNTRITNYLEENKFMYPNDNYVYGWEYDDEKNHQKWLEKLDDYGSDLESESETESEYDNDDY